MRKLISLLLATAILLSLVSPAPAETIPAEQTARDGSTFPFILVGMPAGEAINALRESWERSYFRLGEMTEENRTLEDGKEIQVYSLSGEGTNYSEGVTMGIRLYADQEILTAGVMTVDIPEGQNPDTFRENILISNFGQPEKLSLDGLGSFRELLGEDALLENGEDLWRYDLYLMIPGLEVDLSSTPTIKVFLTSRAVDSKIYVAVFPDPASTDSGAGKTGGTNLADLEGYGGLTQEERAEVSRYADYLESKKKTELEAFIAYLTQKHK